MPRPVHFEIPADNIERAVKFFTDVFGWKINDWGGGMQYYLAETGPEPDGINGAISARNPILNSVTNSIQVTSIDEIIPKIEANRGTIVHAKMQIPCVGWSAYFKDTEGNVHGLFQPDESAH
jgi:uncharacterized protein